MNKFISFFIVLAISHVSFVAADNESETVIYLTRHGQTHWNVAKRWQGITDTHLTILGVEQAVEKSLFFQDMPIAAIYSSPLKRAHLTAQIIATAHSSDVKTHPGLGEYWMGVLQGMQNKDIHSLIDQRLGAMTQEERRNSGYFDGLQSYAETANQLNQAMERIADSHLGETVVAVTHSGILRTILAMRTDAKPETIKMTNMAYLKFVYDNEALKLVEISPDIVYETYEKQKQQ